MTCAHRYRIMATHKRGLFNLGKLLQRIPQLWPLIRRICWTNQLCRPTPSTRWSKEQWATRRGPWVRTTCTIRRRSHPTQQPTRTVAGGWSTLPAKTVCACINHPRTTRASWVLALMVHSTTRVSLRVTWPSWTLRSTTTQASHLLWIAKTSVFSRRKIFSCRRPLEREKVAKGSNHIFCRQIKSSLTKKTFRRDLKSRMTCSTRCTATTRGKTQTRGPCRGISTLRWPTT